MLLTPRFTLPLLLVALLSPSALAAAPQETAPPPDLPQRFQSWLEEVEILMTPK